MELRHDKRTRKTKTKIKAGRDKNRTMEGKRKEKGQRKLHKRQEEQGEKYSIGAPVEEAASWKRTSEQRNAQNQKKDRKDNILIRIAHLDSS